MWLQAAVADWYQDSMRTWRWYRSALLTVLAGCSPSGDGDDDPGVTCGAGTHEEGGVCVVDSVVDAGAIDAGGPPPGAKRVFVTRTTYTGELGELAGADALCQNAATAANLGGVWHAWLSDFTHDAISRITGSGPWYDLDGRMVFANRAGLATAPLVGINVQESGAPLIIGDRVWTGTRAGGMRSGTGASQLCGEWTSRAGTAAAGHSLATDGAWTENETVPCNNQARLYCFEL